jgi:hypothetical protein
VTVPRKLFQCNAGALINGRRFLFSAILFSDPFLDTQTGLGRLAKAGANSVPSPISIHQQGKGALIKFQEVAGNDVRTSESVK